MTQKIPWKLNQPPSLLFISLNPAMIPYTCISNVLLDDPPISSCISFDRVDGGHGLGNALSVQTLSPVSLLTLSAYMRKGYLHK